MTNKTVVLSFLLLLNNCANSQQCFSVAGFYHQSDQDSINAIYSNFIEGIFPDADTTHAKILQSKVNLYPGGTPNRAYPYLYYNILELQDVRKEWLNSESIRDLELYLEWNKMSDTLFVNALSLVTQNSNVNFLDYLNGLAEINVYEAMYNEFFYSGYLTEIAYVNPECLSDKMGYGFAPNFRIPYNETMLSLLNHHQRTQWKEYLNRSFARSYCSNNSEFADTLDITVEADTSSYYQLKPKDFFNCILEPILDSGKMKLFKDSNLELKFNYDELWSLFNPTLIRERMNLNDSVIHQVKSIERADRIFLRIHYHTFLSNSGTTGNRYFYSFQPYSLEIQVPGGDRAFIQYSNFMEAIKIAGYAPDLFESAFKFSLLSHFKINQYWDGTQLD